MRAGTTMALASTSGKSSAVSAMTDNTITTVRNIFKYFFVSIS